MSESLLSKKLEQFVPNVLASFVLFLIAIPLNLGIALASGASATQGLTTGIVGALIVSLLAGAPLMVSAPAAGLIAVVWQITELHGMANLGLVVLLAGVCQVLIGVFNFGPWFRAVSPAVIHGMLAGIGLLIFSSQFHVMMGLQPDKKGVNNIITIPHAIWEAATSGSQSPPFLSGCVGVLTIVLLIVWAFAPGKLKMIPPPLIAAGGAILLAWLGKFDIAYVSVPENLAAEFHTLHLSQLKLVLDPSIIGSVLGLTFIATAQTLLTATAVDRLHDFKNTDYNKEVMAQGAGNAVSGFLGALPLCGVIVRSGANVQSGATGRWSNFLHGVWLAVFILFFANFLALIPVSALAAILVYTGLRLVKLESIRELKRFGRMEFVIYSVTVVTIILTDLLTGILAGFVMSALRLLYNLTHCEILVTEGKEGEPITVCLRGSATFFTLPSLARRLESLPKGTEIEVLVEHLNYIDHACLEQILVWEEEYIAQGGRISIAWNHLMGRFNSSPSAGLTNGNSVTPLVAAEARLSEIQQKLADEQRKTVPDDHYVKLAVKPGSSTAVFQNKAIWELAGVLPPNVLIVLVQRHGEILIPKGKKVLQENDVITLLGEKSEVATIRQTYQDGISVD